MAVNEYLGEDLLRVAVTPARVVYLFPDGDVTAFRKALQAASGRWAGMTEPIVPVQAGGAIDDGWVEVVETLAPVAAINVGCPEGEAQLAAAHLGLPAGTLATLDHGSTGWTLPWQEVALPAGGTHVAARFGSALWEAAAAGDPSEAPDHPRGDAHRGRTDDIVGRAAATAATVLEASLAGISAYVGTGSPEAQPAVVWLTEPDSLADCVLFWNLRALRSPDAPRVPFVLLPRHALTEWASLRDLIEGLLRRPRGGAPDVVLVSLSVDDEALRTAAEVLGLVAHEGPVGVAWTRPLPAVRQPPFSYASDVDPRDWLLGYRNLGYWADVRVQRTRQGTSVPVHAVRLHEVLGRPVAMVLHARVSGGFLSALPRRESVAKLLSPSATWQQGGLSLGVYYHLTSDVHLDSPTPDAVLAALVSDTPCTSAVSAPGRVAAALLAARDCSVLRRPDALRVIAALTTPRSKELLAALRTQEPGTADQRLVELAATWGGRADRRSRTVNELGGVAVLPTLEALVAGGWTERGLQTQCDRCGLRSFVPLRLTTANAGCPGCGADAHYATGLHGLEVLYRLDTLADHASDQGVLPHLAALLALRAHDADSHLHLGLDLEWPDASRNEVDLFGRVGQLVVAGEVKTTARAFTEQQISRDVRLSAQLGVDSHIIACTETLGSALTNRIRDLAREHRLGVLVVEPDADRRTAVTAAVPP